MKRHARRRKNPERWLAPKLSPAERERLEQLHAVYFPMFVEIETVPEGAVDTGRHRYVTPEGYALLYAVGGQDYLFFQDAPPDETWSFVAMGPPERIEHLRDYLAVLERINELTLKSVRRHNGPGAAADFLGLQRLRARLLAR